MRFGWSWGFIHFIPDSLTYSVPLLLKRQCDRTLGGPHRQCRRGQSAGLLHRPAGRCQLAGAEWRWHAGASSRPGSSSGSKRAVEVQGHRIGGRLAAENSREAVRVCKQTGGCDSVEFDVRR